MHNKVLIGCTSFNRMSYTKKCLEALEKTEYPFDCIIADNGSREEAIEYLKQWDGKVLPNGSTFKVLLLGKNYGVGKALNKVLAFRSPEQHFMKLDNDTLAPTQEIFINDVVKITKEQVNTKWLEDMVDFIENNENGRFKSVAFYFYDRNRSTHAPIEFIKTTTGHTYEIENPHNHMLGAGIVWHKDVMNKLLKFSEDKIYGFEDTSFSQASMQYGENAWARWLNAIHIDQLDLGKDTEEILAIKRASLSGQLSVPKD